jgi:two-component system response regulator CpxR
MDAGARRVQRGEELLGLTAVEFDLLGQLLQAAGSVVEREQIALEVLDRKLLPFDRSIDTHIVHLRRKLGPHPDGAERIKTVRGVGYIYTLPS